MKKLLLMGFVTLAFASCVSDKEVAPLTPAQQTTQKFEQLFVNTFGQPASNQTWVYNTPIINDTEAASRRSTYADGNNWGESWYVPAPLTASQKAIVTAYFTAVNQPQGVSLDYKNFFCQNVSSTDRGKSNMNFFYCGTGENNRDHVNNYNAGDESNYGNVFGGQLKPGTEGEDWNNRKVYYSDKIQLQVETSTANFGFHCSYDDHYDNTHGVIIPGTTIMAWAKENAKDLVKSDADVTGMHFLGFDYNHSKTQGSEYDVVEADGFYNDWIIRITPGIKKPSDGRIIAEDLGALESGADLDYNDVVFDVEFTSDGARIVLLNAGGTLPLYVGGQEVHEMYGVSTSTMVINDPTNLNPDTDIKEFYIKGNFNWNPLSIPVRVTKTVNGEKVTIELEATQGVPAGKIQVDRFFMWTDERESIASKYAKFSDWVKDPNVKWY